MHPRTYTHTNAHTYIHTHIFSKEQTCILCLYTHTVYSHTQKSYLPRVPGSVFIHRCLPLYSLRTDPVKPSPSALLIVQSIAHETSDGIPVADSIFCNGQSQSVILYRQTDRQTDIVRYTVQTDRQKISIHSIQGKMKEIFTRIGTSKHSRYDQIAEHPSQRHYCATSMRQIHRRVHTHTPLRTSSSTKFILRKYLFLREKRFLRPGPLFRGIV